MGRARSVPICIIHEDHPDYPVGGACETLKGFTWTTDGVIGVVTIKYNGECEMLVVAGDQKCEMRHVETGE